MGDLDSSLVGESAAVLTSCFWTAGSLFFTSAGKRIGAFNVNAYRTAMAIGLLFAAHVVLLGTLVPAANSAQWGWMGLSGIVGLGVGDLGLFAAYVAIGPRLTLLIESSAPIFASLGQYFILGEPMSALSVLGISVTLAGIVVVLSEVGGKLGDTGVATTRMTRGIFFGLVSAAGQGFGAVISRVGMYANSAQALNPVSAALIRMLFAGAFLWTFILIAGKASRARSALKDSTGIRYAAAGAVVGPFIGMTLSMVAIQEAQVGIAQTLMSLMPIFIIPVIWVLYHEKTDWHGILGAFIAVLGVAILFLT